MLIVCCCRFCRQELLVGNTQDTMYARHLCLEMLDEAFRSLPKGEPIMMMESTAHGSGGYFRERFMERNNPSECTCSEIRSVAEELGFNPEKAFAWGCPVHMEKIRK